ncbi:MAG TPA: hypothetical protein VGQ56_05460 [Gemmatimonadaceae bacterium]|nr:hypothetical protein [Gemmatimonadaceae bacterium]
MRSATVVSLLSLVFAASARALAQDRPHPSGEQLGTVHFPTSCDTAVAPRFDRAVALLHSFEFGASIRAFNDVLTADPTCAMAYWGIALSRWTNPMAAGTRTPAQLAPGRQAAEAGFRASPRATERERLYIAAVGQLYKDYEHVDQGARVAAYAHAMEGLVAKQPADTEAKIFYAIALTASAPPTDKTYANQLKAGSILEPLWAAQPNHPGLAHYIIHTYDVPALAPKAAAAADRYSVIAPSAAHALHMPSHTFTRLGAWTNSIETNVRSAEVALRDSAIGEALHASDYSMYAYLQLAQDSAAKALLARLPSLAARFDPTAITGAAPPSAAVFAIAAIPARYALERRDWRAAVALEPKTSAFPWTEAMTYFARSLGASHLSDTATARAAIDTLTAIHQRLGSRGESYWAEQVAVQRLGAQAWLALAQHRPDTALALMREAGRREDATEKNAVTPGPLAPARELLGDLLMEMKRPREALVEYRATLRKEPNRFRALYGAMRAASLAGDRATAVQYRSMLKTLCAKSDVPGRPELADIR